MGEPSVKVICHSQAPNGEELITMEVEFHRFILAEINTHRVLSRNYQSSRAVPVEKMIEQVRNDPAMPVHWGKNQRGMQAEEESRSKVQYPVFNNIGEMRWPTEISVESAWRKAAEQASSVAEALHNAGYHKQIVNRLLEPFIWTKGVITATKEGWESVFKLRCHKDAQPEFQALAYKIKEAIENSIPTKLECREYHLPYYGVWKHTKTKFIEGCDVYIPDNKVDDRNNFIEEAIKISTSCCAQVSYRVLDDSLEKANKIYNMLNLPVKGVYPEDPPHFSPAEHVAKVIDEVVMEKLHQPSQTGNFDSCTFWQYRKALELGLEGEFIK